MIRRARSTSSPEAESGRPTRSRGTAKDRALRLLATRWRSEAELRQRLRAAGFPPEEIEAALEGLDRTGLVDDERFAREMVRNQAGRRGASNRAMASALRGKGVPVAIIEQAVAAAGSDADRALALAESRAIRLGSLAPDAAYRRLFGLLTRRGYAPDVAREACRAALASAAQADTDADGFST